MAAETTLAAQLAEDAAERLLRYVRIDTQSDEDSETYPSTDGQLVLLRLLRDELEQIGLADAAIDEHGYVTATLPATVDHEVPTIALFAHVDTAREVSGAASRRSAIALRRRRDRARQLGPGDPPGGVARARAPRRARAHHHRRDDACSAPTTRPASPRSWPRSAISSRTPRSRTGRSRSSSTRTRRSAAASSTSRSRASARSAAYTVDGSTTGELQSETFSGAQVRMRIRGRAIHPGWAKGELVNAIKLAARDRRAAPAGHALAGDDRRTRGLRPPRARRRATRPRSSCASSSATSTTTVSTSTSPSCAALAEEVCGRRAALLDRGRGPHPVPEPARRPRAAPRDRREPRGGGPPRRPRAAAHGDPRRHRRLGADRDGPPDAEHLHRRPRRAQRARVDLRRGHGPRRGDARRARPRVG